MPSTRYRVLRDPTCDSVIRPNGNSPSNTVADPKINIWFSVLNRKPYLFDEGAEKEWKNNNGEPNGEQAGMRVSTAISFTSSIIITSHILTKFHAHIKTTTTTTTTTTIDPSGHLDISLFFYKSDKNTSTHQKYLNLVSNSIKQTVFNFE